jgi:uncharacterized membrane protein YhaH (DUF805 family)
MNLMIEPILQYGNFTGRARRKQFWMFFLFQMIVNAVFIFFAVALGDDDPPLKLGIVAIIWFLWFLAMIVPNASLIIRRMRDQNIPGWVGGLLYGSTIIFSSISLLIIFVFMCIPGTRGPNQFGPDPKEEESIQDIFA